MRKRKILDPGLKLAIAAAGSKYKLAKALEIGLPSVSRWKRIPSARVIKIESIFKVDRERLRPDLYPPRRNTD